MNYKVVSLHKYWIWSNLMKKYFEAALKNQPVGKTVTFCESSYIFMSYWYAGLYVVVEGWQELKLNDKKIDLLLASPNVQFLKRYRHGVCHFQEKYFDERFQEFIRDGQDCVAWIRKLHSEFGRYFLKWHAIEKLSRAKA